MGRRCGKTLSPMPPRTASDDDDDDDDDDGDGYDEGDDFLEKLEVKHAMLIATVTIK